MKEPVHMNQWWNSNTNSKYDSIKAILKVPYKWKLIKKFFADIEILLKQNSRLKNELEKLKIKNKPEKKLLEELEKLIKTENNEWIKVLFNTLKSNLWKKEYNVEIEIQIFDVNNYFKAEVDTESPAHHDHYKKRQILDWLWCYFPFEVYWAKRLERAISDFV